MASDLQQLLTVRLQRAGVRAGDGAEGVPDAALYRSIKALERVLFDFVCFSRERLLRVYRMVDLSAPWERW